jgi:hypothetical protein
MMNKRSYVALALLLALAACGGSSNDHGNDNGQAANPGPTDAFLAKVQALIGNSPDNTEPESIDAVAVTTPETTEPAPL